MSMNYQTGREPVTRDTTPVLLTTGVPVSIVIAGLVPGPPVVLPTLDLMNTLRVPVEVTELHFMCFATSFQPDYLELSLNLGGHSIAQWAPMAAIDVRRHAVAREVGISGASTTHRWVLPRPLIVAPNEGFAGMVRWTPLIAPTANGTVQFSMVARGRRLPGATRIARVRDIPWASGTYFPVAADGTPAPDMTFRNPFPSVLHVASINATSAVGGMLVSVARFLGVRINGPGGLSNNVIRSLVDDGATAVFGERNAIEEPHDLEPGDAHQITFYDYTAALEEPLAAAITGWREE